MIQVVPCLKGIERERHYRSRSNECERIRRPLCGITIRRRQDSNVELLRCENTTHCRGWYSWSLTRRRETAREIPNITAGLIASRARKRTRQDQNGWFQITRQVGTRSLQPHRG